MGCNMKTVGNHHMRFYLVVGMMGLSMLLLGATCRNRGPVDSQEEGLTAKRFVGPWVAATVDVDIRTKNGIGGPEHLHFDSKDLAADQGRKPAMTIFNADGSYREETFNLKDSLLQARAGFWHLYEDSLYMRLNVEGSPKIAFKAQIEGKGLKLSSTIDWDGDEAKDDEMIVELKRP
jgi:hypothetical protein